ncbi:MAG: DUF4272 domain-containing protein [Actinobacteria bacterium]|nr:DUF4272 domain-containing protein [Actinomycetota bacterium]
MTMPVNVFGRRSEVADVAYRLVGALDDAKVELAGTTAARVSGRLPGGSTVIVDVTTEHLRGEQGAAQRAGMTDWLSQPELVGSGRASALALVPDLHVSISFTIDDGADQDAVDAVVELAVRCAAWTDGLVLAMASGVVLGPDGSVWLEPRGVPTPAARMDDDPLDGLDPLVREARAVLDREGVPEGGVVLDAQLTDAVPAADPPAVDRVGRRLVVTAAVAARSLAETEGRNLDAARTGLLDWVEDTGAAVELEPWEASLLDAPAGGLSERDRIDGAWRTEAAVVLAWALGLVELPPADRIADPGALFDAVGLPSTERTTSILESAVLRPTTDLLGLRDDLAELRSTGSIGVERSRAAEWLADGGSFGRIA